MAVNPTKTVTNPRIAKLIELEVAGRIKPIHQQELDTYRAQGLAPKGISSSLTETQGKNTGFYARATEADRNFQGTSSATDPQNDLQKFARDKLPTGVVNAFTGEDRQLSEQAKRNFIAATLRAESGAAIGENEYQNQEKIFFPQAGEGPAVIAQKARDRQIAIDALRASAGEGPETLDTAEAVQPAKLPEADFQRQLLERINAGDLEGAKRLAASQGGQIANEEEVVAARNSGLPLRRVEQQNPSVEAEIAKRVQGTDQFGSALYGAADTATLGFADELVAGGQSVVDSLQGEGSFSDRYAQNIAIQRGVADRLQARDPATYLGGQVLGGFALPVGGANTVRRLATAGAGYGGAYGFGSGDGDLGQRTVAALSGAAAGGLVGAGGGALAQRFANRPPPPPGGGQAAELMAAAQRQGINPLPADVGGPFTRRATSAAAQLPFSAGSVVRGGQRVIDESGAARDRIAAGVGNVVDPVEAGERAIAGAQAYRTRTSARGGGLYDEAASLAGNATVDPARAREVLDGHIAELSQTPGGAAGLEALTELRGALDGQFSVQGIRNMRTALRDDFANRGLRGSDLERRGMQVVEAATDDIVQSLRAQGREEAAQAYQRADRYWRQRLDTIDNTLAPIIGRNAEKSGEQVFQALQTATRSNTARLASFVRALPAEEAATVRATMINQLGRANAGTQNAEGTAFSLNQFLTHWNQMTPRAKEALFRGESRAALDDLARVAEGSRGASGYANRSNTGGVIGAGVTAGTLAVDATTLAGTAAAQYVTGRLLASPRFAQWLARAPRTQEGQQRWARQLSRIATREPSIANDLLPIQQALSQSPARAAAEEPRQ